MVDMDTINSSRREPDLEQGISLSTEKVEAVNITKSPADMPTPETFVTHSNEALLQRAREMNATGQFVFTTYSELNIFLLLRSQDEILQLQDKLYKSLKGEGAWTDEDGDNLAATLKRYRMDPLITAPPPFCLYFIQLTLPSSISRSVVSPEDHFTMGTTRIQSERSCRPLSVRPTRPQRIATTRDLYFSNFHSRKGGA